MPMMISIARSSTTENPMKSATFHAEHAAMFGDAITIKAIIPDANDAYQYAVVGDVKDIEHVRKVSRTPEGDALLRKYGFVEQLSYFWEGE